jgi:hypothetical protein
MGNKTLRVVAVALIVLAGAGVLSFAEYDKAAVQKAMQNNAALYPKLTAAANAARYMEAAGYLLSIAQGMYSIKDYAPTKGEKAAWDATIGAFLKAAFRGLGACASEDQAVLKAAVAEMAQDRNQGHASFR